MLLSYEMHPEYGKKVIYETCITCFVKGALLIMVEKVNGGSRLKYFGGLAPPCPYFTLLFPLLTLPIPPPYR